MGRFSWSTDLWGENYAFRDLDSVAHRLGYLVSQPGRAANQGWPLVLVRPVLLLALTFLFRSG